MRNVILCSALGIIVSLAVMTLFQGCSVLNSTAGVYALDTARITAETASLRNRYDGVEKTLRTMQAEKKLFSDEEWRKLLNVDATIDMIIMRYDGLVQFQYTEIALDDVKFIYGLAEEAYRSGREVIMAHWQELDPSTQVMLNAFDNQAQLISDEVTKIIDNPNNSNINNAMTLILGILNTGVKMLGLFVL